MLEISIEDAWDQFLKQNRLCALTGLPLSFAKCVSRTRNVDATASLDRIDSSKGYILGNIQWIHKRLQGMKSNMPQNEFIRWCHAVASHCMPGQMDTEETGPIVPLPGKQTTPNDSGVQLWEQLGKLDDDLLDPNYPEALVTEELQSLGIDPQALAERTKTVVAEAKALQGTKAND